MQHPGPLKVGAAKVDITPKSLEGFWSVWATRFTGVHDPIYVRALVIDNGVTSVTLVSADLVEFGDTEKLQRRREREVGIPADHVMISATHDHNVPRGGPITPSSSSAQGRPFSPKSYIDFVNDSIVHAVQFAKSSMQPGQVGVGRGQADVNVNRNGFNGTRFGGADPEGPSDKTVWVVRFESLAGDPIALIMNYAVHSVVAGPQSTLISGDLAGAAERVVEGRYRNKVVALWTMGSAGMRIPSTFVEPRMKTQVADLPMRRWMRRHAHSTGSSGHGQPNQNTGGECQNRGFGTTFTCPTVPPKPRPATAGRPMFPPNPDFRETFPTRLRWRFISTLFNSIKLH